MCVSELLWDGGGDISRVVQKERDDAVGWKRFLDARINNHSGVTYKITRGTMSNQQLVGPLCIHWPRFVCLVTKLPTASLLM